MNDRLLSFHLTSLSGNGAANPVHLRRYVLDADSRVLDVSVNARIFPEWMRTAATIQSRGQCEQHGCDSPHHWLQMDHVNPVANRGETRFDNIQAGCRPDNQAKGATTGHIPWRDKPPPPRRKPRRHANSRKNSGDNDPDADDQGHVIF